MVNTQPVFSLDFILISGHSSFRLNNSLTRSLKIKLKQRRDIIEQSEVSDRNLS